ncbi:hypothetical protein GOBAR_DD12808 [Gossypium barbadense]|nr:hypothetical protein GOBAR_DD12808 [Gossypium barbadense]
MLSKPKGRRKRDFHALLRSDFGGHKGAPAMGQVGRSQVFRGRRWWQRHARGGWQNVRRWGIGQRCATLEALARVCCC